MSNHPINLTMKQVQVSCLKQEINSVYSSWSLACHTCNSSSLFTMGICGATCTMSWLMSVRFLRLPVSFVFLVVQSTPLSQGQTETDAECTHPHTIDAVEIISLFLPKPSLFLSLCISLSLAWENVQWFDYDISFTEWGVEWSYFCDFLLTTLKSIMLDFCSRFKGKCHFTVRGCMPL